MTPRSRSDAFTLIELLVVIAIIAILAAALMPALSSALDRTRVTECRSNLTHIGIALRMFYNDHGSYPDSLNQLVSAGLITDDSLLICTKTGQQYHYERPTGATPSDGLVCSCCSPATPDGQRPHSYRHSYVALQKGGKIEEPGR